MDEQNSYFVKTAISELEKAERFLSQRRVAKAQEHLREARHWSYKVPEEGFTGTDFLDNLRELELKLFRGF